MNAIYFKILHRRFRFRNPKQILSITTSMHFSNEEMHEARSYLESLRQQGIQYTYPGCLNYPASFLKMKEPPLFVEYLGQPIWKGQHYLSVVGARDMHTLTQEWLKQHLADFLSQSQAGVVSGGAFGVDYLCHLIAIKNQSKTIVVLPSGLNEIYPAQLLQLKLSNSYKSGDICFISEFEHTQKVHKSFFFFRNRLIASLGEMTLVAQAQIKSGSLLTVHHALENGRPVLVIPSHPQMLGFEGNQKLLLDGAYPVTHSLDLLYLWQAEEKQKQEI